MRMWMVDPALLCRKHLLGEHNELHMLAGSLLRGKGVQGFVQKGLLEPARLHQRHDALAREMLARGYKHQSPLPEEAEVLAALAAYPEHVRRAVVEVAVSAQELRRRCSHCAQRMEQSCLSGVVDTEYPA